MADTSLRRDGKSAVSTSRIGRRRAGSSPAPVTIFVRHRRLTPDPKYYREVVDESPDHYIVRPGNVLLSQFKLPPSTLLAFPKADYERVPTERKGKPK